MLCHLWPVGRVPTCIWRWPLSQELSATVLAGAWGPAVHPVRSNAASVMVVIIFMAYLTSDRKRRMRPVAAGNRGARGDTDDKP